MTTWNRIQMTLVLVALIQASHCLQDGDIRLVGGAVAFEGRVEVYYNSSWGTVCDDDWDDREARVVCRQKGFAGGEAVHEAHFGKGSGEILLDNIGCDGTESTLSSCSHEGLGIDNCDHSEDAGVVCDYMRLAGGATPYEGRVEINHNGIWGTVCDDDWNEKDARAVCGTLKMTGGEPRRADTFRQGSGPTWYTNLTCITNDHTDSDCQAEESQARDCVHAGVHCTPGVRLVGGLTSYEGRVELMRHGTWGTLCAGVDKYDARVICRQMGLSSRTVVPRSYFGLGTGPLWVRVGKCTGDETHFESCRSHVHRHAGCSLRNDVGVICQDVRLVGGRTVYEGRVEVFYNGTWGTVCDDDWSNIDASVVCKMLDLSGGHAKREAFFGRGSGPVVYSKVICNGSEPSLHACLLEKGVGGHCRTRDVGVVCKGGVRLVDGSTPYQGRVEVFHNGTWGSVCGRWGHTEARVVCKGIGLLSGYPTFNANFGEGSGAIWYRNEVCTGYEEKLEACDHNLSVRSSCSHSRDPGVMCQDVRLVGGSTPYEGRVEVYHRGTWGTICDHNWSIVDASVVCSSFGLTGGEPKSGAHFGPGTGPIWYHNVNCSGTESSLTSCRKDPVKDNVCSHEQDAGVVCIGGIRLVGGSVPWEGRLEVFHYGSWGSVCDDRWDELDSRVACRELGYSGGKVSNHYVGSGKYFYPMENSEGIGAGTGVIWYDDVQCSGDECSLFHCPKSHIGNHNCGHNEDVQLVCEVAPDRTKCGTPYDTDSGSSTGSEVTTEAPSSSSAVPQSLTSGDTTVGHLHTGEMPSLPATQAKRKSEDHQIFIAVTSSLAPVFVIIIILLVSVLIRRRLGEKEKAAGLPADSEKGSTEAQSDIPRYIGIQENGVAQNVLSKKGVSKNDVPKIGKGWSKRKKNKKNLRKGSLEENNAHTYMNVGLSRVEEEVITPETAARTYETIPVTSIHSLSNPTHEATAVSQEVTYMNQVTTETKPLPNGASTFPRVNPILLQLKQRLDARSLKKVKPQTPDPTSYPEEAVYNTELPFPTDINELT